jgi:NADPH:quinone reductase-like Zn-dependent oxidoreductase
VSVAALQFAVAVGAIVVATTSSEEKGLRLKALGASHIVNYRQTPSWGAVAKELTPSGRGFDIIVDVGGNATLSQSVAAVRRNGVMTVIGMIGEADAEPTPMMAVLFVACVVRGILLGSRAMMRSMVKFVEDNKIKLALDDEVFALADLKDAFKRLEEQKHFSKVVIQIPGKIQSEEV